MVSSRRNDRGVEGVPATTLDADFWIDLPERQGIRLLNLCTRLGARVIANTVVALEDDTLVNFLYRVDGLASFATEARRALVMEWLGMKVKVLPLARVIRSKEFVGRPRISRTCRYCATFWLRAVSLLVKDFHVYGPIFRPCFQCRAAVSVRRIS